MLNSQDSVLNAKPAKTKHRHPRHSSIQMPTTEMLTKKNSISTKQAKRATLSKPEPAASISLIYAMHTPRQKKDKRAYIVTCSLSLACGSVYGFHRWHNARIYFCLKLPWTLGRNEKKKLQKPASPLLHSDCRQPIWWTVGLHSPRKRILLTCQCLCHEQDWCQSPHHTCETTSKEYSKNTQTHIHKKDKRLLPSTQSCINMTNAVVMCHPT